MGKTLHNRIRLGNRMSLVRMLMRAFRVVR